jgi:hypothetical protein
MGVTLISLITRWRRDRLLPPLIGVPAFAAMIYFLLRMI